MICPSLAVISWRTALSRSSNSPRYLAPATSAPTSSAQTRLPFSPSGTSPATIRCARPSAIAVFPAGLADQHRVVLRAAREHLDRAPDLLVPPDHGVELALLGERGQVAAVLLERLVRALGVLDVTRWPPRTSLSASSRASRGTSSSASSRCSSRRTRRRALSLPRKHYPGPDGTLLTHGVALPRPMDGCWARRASASALSSARRLRRRARRACAAAPGRAARASRWSGVSSGLPARRASSCAPRDSLPALDGQLLEVHAS